MKIKRSSAIRVLFLTGALSFLDARAFAQPAPASHATDFTSLEYYPPPNQTQIKSRMSGAEAQPMPGGLLIIKQLKLVMFSTNGIPQAIIQAPECVYDTLHDTATSAGHLQLQSGDGKIRVDGDGFWWRQEDSFLSISNNVRTVIQNEMVKPGTTGKDAPEKKS